MESKIQRLNPKATTYEEAKQYVTTRAMQIASCGFHWDGQLREIDGGYVSYFMEIPTTDIFMMVYILDQNRNKGLFKKAVREGRIDKKIITAHDCEIENFLNRNKVPFKVVTGIFESAGYKMVQEEYGSQIARRSGVYYMNHIDEAMYILKRMGATEDAMEAYCLHPLLQGDADLKKNLFKVCENIRPYIVGLAMEFRNISNQYLSQRADKFFSIDMKLSPLYEVNQMLAADKIQNYKDFILYHKGIHIRSKYLEKYFETWLDALSKVGLQGLTDKVYFEWWFNELNHQFPKKEAK